MMFMAANPKIVTRVAPSPTGLFHVGTARTALFNYLYARKHGGKFILRIEDTDKARSEKKYEEDIVNGLKWLGLNWDEFYRQSERTEVYKKYLQKLLDVGKAYLDGNAVRFKNPNKKVVFNDIIRGEIATQTDDVGDFVIAKDLETPLFHFTVVVDDFEMGVTHIIRGEDHISNTPRHILLQEALGFNIPQYAHLPLILGTDRSKLSKRHGAASVNEYREDGYLPEAIVNFLAFIGWNPGDEREIFSLPELVKEFSLERIQKGAGVFNIERLNWYNKEYIKKIEPEKLAQKLFEYLPDEWKKEAEKNKAMWLKIVNLEKDRIEKLSDIKGGIGYFFNKPVYEKDLLLWRKEPDLANTKKHLEEVVKSLSAVDENNFEADKIKEAVWNFAEQEGRGSVLWPFRVALTGLEKSPDPFAVASILGKKETLDRLKNAAEKI
ncbi:MAG: glutamate--tRNA ligase [Candidatus Pacebacteria bacterium]|nr:glutamate--tRNA ligase [Candidatus Paceibacterota bacterium]NUQ57394.1 glutamate--tRNA ligase [Candidatus Paceibacter sp.]